MSSIRFPLAVPELTVIPVPTVVGITMSEDVSVPAGITDLKSFRDWVESPESPGFGRIDFLDNEIWADMATAVHPQHGQVKTAIGRALETIVTGNRKGRYFSTGAMFCNLEANLLTEPDGLYSSRAVGRAKRGSLLPADGEVGRTIVEGSPDMVLEVMSHSTVRQDAEILPELYHRAGVAEYWRVNAKGPPHFFRIFRRTADGYAPTIGVDGWWRSDVFGGSFRFTEVTGGRGEAESVLQHRE